MGFTDLFYPDRKRQLRPKYRKHCNCDDCVHKSHSYGEMWRHNTPVCTCCDCMAIAGENVPHTHSTYEHTHAATHTCAMPGNIRHRSHPNKPPCCETTPVHEPPPKYSFKPQTTHKVDNCCGPRYYTTPIFPDRQPAPRDNPHSCGTHHGHATCPAPACSSATPPNGYNELIYLRTPHTYHPCNR
ncbi:hypothetical protein GGF46_004696 [Coemansia sp. RSA 552]|nr:hypothetical protein GGF46_004696 [Coemansia sp. RSA 552]